MAPSEDRPHVDHFRRLWTQSFVGFLRVGRQRCRACLPDASASGSPLSSCRRRSDTHGPLSPMPKAAWREEGDRWQQALVLTEIASSVASPEAVSIVGVDLRAGTAAPCF